MCSDPQSAICYFFLLYTYDTTSSSSNGYDVYIYEFSSVMAIAAVIITNFYQGFNTFAWNWWVFGSVLVGPVLILCYVAVYASISPGWIWTDVYGLNSFLWPSAYFWFGLVFCFIVAFIPRYLTRYNKDWYNQADDTILKAVHRRDPNHDFVNDPMIPAVKQRQAYRPSNAVGADADEGLPMQTLAQQGRRMTDVDGNLVPVSSRGFAFVSIAPYSIEWSVPPG